MKEPLTAKQLAILDFIRDFQKRCGCPPSYDEMCAHFKVFRNAIHQQIKAIEKKGYLNRRSPGIARGIVIVSRGNRRGSIWENWEPADAKPTHQYE